MHRLTPCAEARSWARFWERPKHALFPQSHGLSGLNVYRKVLPELSRSSGGFRCGGIAMSTQDAESAKFGGKRAPCWPVTPVAGIKLQDLSLPPSARCWKPDGSRADRVFGRHRMAVPLWTAPCSTRRRSSTVSPVIWRCKHGKQRPGILPVPVWRKVSSQISQRKPDLS